MQELVEMAYSRFVFAGFPEALAQDFTSKVIRDCRSFFSWTDMPHPKKVNMVNMAVNNQIDLFTMVQNQREIVRERRSKHLKRKIEVEYKS